MYGFLGILFSLFGSGEGVGVLVAKTVPQPLGIAITNSGKIVWAMDVSVVAANITLIAAYLVGTAIAFWLLDGCITTITPARYQNEINLTGFVAR